MRDFLDVEGELRLHMLMFAFGIVHNGAVFRAELGKLDGNRDIGGLGVAERVADVVREAPTAKASSLALCALRKSFTTKSPERT